MPFPSKVDTLYDQTSAANTPISTGSLNTADYDGLLVECIFSAAAAGAPTIALRDAASTVAFHSRTVGATAVTAMLSYGIGGGGTGDSAGGYSAGPGGPVPAAVTAECGAAGVGVTTHLIVRGRRQFRGSVAVATSVDGVTPRTLD